MAKLDREELQRDEVAEGIHGAYEWSAGVWSRYRTLILIAAALILLAVVAFSIVNARHQRRIARTNELLAQSMQSLNQALTTQDQDERAALLDEAVTTAEDLIETYGGSDLVRPALFVQGSAHALEGEFEQATRAFEAYLDRALEDPDRARGRIALASMIENQSFLIDDPVDRAARLEEARDLFGVAASEAAPDSYLYYHARMGEARTLAALERPDEAATIYREVAEEHPPEQVLPDWTGFAREGEFALEFGERALENVMPKLTFGGVARYELDRLASAPLPTRPVPVETPAPIPTPLLELDRTTPTRTAIEAEPTSPPAAPLQTPTPTAGEDGETTGAE